MKKKDFSDSLVEEGLREAADNFFSRRVRLEEDIDILHDMAADLKKFEQHVRNYENTFLYLILRGRTDLIEELYQRLGVEAGEEDVQMKQDQVRLEFLRIPSAFTLRVRYRKLLLASYGLFHNVIDEYYHGRIHSPHAHPRKKIRSVSYDQLRNFAREINERIRAMNKHSRTSDVLQFSKKLDVDRMDKERITDSGIEYTLDKEMEFSEIEFTHLGLRRFPKLPPPGRVRGELQQFSSEVFEQDPQAVQEIIREVRQSQKEDFD